MRASLTRSKAFEASHRYWLDGCDLAQNQEIFGPEASLWGHGHNFLWLLTLSGPIDFASGMIVNIKDLDAAMASVVTAVDHRFLNEEFAPLAGSQPTPEQLAIALWNQFLSALECWPAVRMECSRLEIQGDLAAEFTGGTTVYVTRSYSFSAAHRLHSPQLDETENLRLYGKCNNPHGHGHDYRLDVTIEGIPDPVTGFVIDPRRLDQIVEQEILAVWDHRHLNEEVVPFADLVPTSENVVQVAWQQLFPRLEGGLRRLVLHETPRSAFAYEG